ncbi:regulatory protein RecX [SAR202 cluster bacterium AD-804-J14_MRT_500m]|nr:regulatory protein RecX [SAR202 cluster bacterium AD-804-J14_MRT_500m]
MTRRLVAKQNLNRNPIDVAFRFLTYRPRSESEVRRRLSRQFTMMQVDETIDKLQERGILDDSAFANFWCSNREQHRPRSKMMLNQELRSFGVSGTIAKEALNMIDDETSALNAGRRYGRRLSTADQQSFYKKMMNHLHRRGFGFLLTQKVARDIWNELSCPADSDIYGNTKEQQPKN